MTVIPAYAKLMPMTPPIQPGSGMLSARAGRYQPKTDFLSIDWAIVMDPPVKDIRPVLYFVTETKSTTNLDELRPEEKRNILCGRSHFGSTEPATKGALDGVDYPIVTTAAELQ